MTTLFRPVLIESAEQAEALPPGTIFWTQRPSGFRYDYGTVGKFGVALASDWTDEPDTLHALVPIEAEEEPKGLRVFPRPADAPWPPGATPNQDGDGRWYFIDEDGSSVGIGDYERPFHDAMVAWIDAQPRTTRYVTPWEEA